MKTCKLPLKSQLFGLADLDDFNDRWFQAIHTKIWENKEFLRNHCFEN